MMEVMMTKFGAYKGRINFKIVSVRFVSSRRKVFQKFRK